MSRRKPETPAPSSRKGVLAFLEEDLQEITENTEITTHSTRSHNSNRNSNRNHHRVPSEQSLIEMDRYERKLACYQELLEEIKSFTDFYFLPIADQLTEEDLEYFFSEIHNR
jgi:hypothetical protein